MVRMGDVLFYKDENGEKRDAELHAEILRNPKANSLADQVAAAELRRIMQRASDAKQSENARH
jgi:hypothetical protein